MLPSLPRLLLWILVWTILSVPARGQAAVSAQGQDVSRVGDLTVRQGDVPRRIVGYGLVVGLEGTGDRSFGSSLSTGAMTVRSVANLLRRFNIEVPPDQLRLRNVAAVLVTAEVSPFLRAGGRFEVQVAALGDATSLRGGVLWMTPMITDPNQPPIGTAQGPLLISGEANVRGPSRTGNSGRIPDGGVLEVDPPAVPSSTEPKLVMLRPDLATANRIANAINGLMGAGVAKAEDPGVIVLKPGPARADSLVNFFAAIDTLAVRVTQPARIIIDAREGTVVAGGEIQVGATTISHHGITLQVGGVGGGPTATGSNPRSAPSPGDSGVRGGGGLVKVGGGATVQDIAAGLYAAGAKPAEIAAIFDALRVAGSLRAQVVIR